MFLICFYKTQVYIYFYITYYALQSILTTYIILEEQVNVFTLYQQVLIE